jgi:hypothetical protein
VIRTACILLFFLLALWTCAYSAVVSIDEIKDIDAGGLLVDIGKVFTVTGVVTVPSGAFSAADLDIYIQDHTAGINVFKTGAADLRLELGDSVIVTGILDQQPAGNSLLRLRTNQDVQIVGRGTVPMPVVVTASDLSASSVPPLEAYEGRLVRVEAATFNTADWPAAGVGKKISASDPTGAFQFMVDRDTDIDGTPAPRQPTILTGVVIQDSRYPYVKGYVVWPRFRYEDFHTRGNGSGTATPVPSIVATGSGPFDLEVTLGGNSLDTIVAFSIDLPIADGWMWEAREEDVELGGGGLEDADYEVTSTGVLVEGAAILDAGETAGRVTLKNITPPGTRRESTLGVLTSVDDIQFDEIDMAPVLKALYPKPDLVISEIYPHDGTTADVNSFIEIHNRGTTTARLDGYAFCEQRPVPYCSPAVKYVFGDSDTIPPDGYLLLVASLAGFEARFGLEPPSEFLPLEVPISPLGRVQGDGGVCGSTQSYEMFALWRDDSLTDLVTYRKYADATVCKGDLCSGSGGSGDVFPYIPPKGYSLLYGTYDPCCPYQVLTSDPTPGAPNVTRYAVPYVERVKSHDKHTMEIFFSEPMGETTAEDPSHYIAAGHQARAVQASLSGDRVLVLFPDLEETATPLEISGVASMPGVAMHDTSMTVTLSAKTCPTLCEIQASDGQGFSPFGGEVVCTLGFITVPPGVFQSDYSSIYIQGLDGCGVNVFSYDVPQPVPVIGDFVSVTGEVTDYVSSGGAGATTEIYMDQATGLSILSRGYPEPDPLIVSTAEVGREIYEGRLLETEGAVVKADSVASFYIDDGSGGIQVYQNYTPIDFTKYEPGMYVKVKGVLLQYDYTAPFFEGYELVPRYLSDIEVIEGAFALKAALKIEPVVFCPSCGEAGFSVGFEAPSQSNVVIRIFDGAGRDVVTLYDGNSPAVGSLEWDGKNSRGERVSPGLYICYLECVEVGGGRKTTDSAPIVVGHELK